MTLYDNSKDIIDIMRLKHNYFKYVDNNDIKSIKKCFTEDAMVNINSISECKTIDNFIQYLSTIKHDKSDISIHTGHNPQINIIEYNKANGIWDLIFFGTIYDIETKSKNLSCIIACYNELYIKDNDTWLIDSMSIQQKYLINDINIKNIEKL